MFLSRIEEFVRDSYDVADAHGFHGACNSIEHYLALVFSEIGEMVNADRCSNYADLETFNNRIKTDDGVDTDDDAWFAKEFVVGIKDSVEDEMADVCIRLFDICGIFDIKPVMIDDADFMKEDFTFIFGGHRFSERAYFLTKILCDVGSEVLAEDKSFVNTTIGSALTMLFHWSMDMGIDLERHIDLKMRYNKTRGFKHGKEY